MPTRRPLRRMIAGSLFSFALASPLAAADWPMFRGPDRDGVAPAAEKAPVEWSTSKDVKWKAELPRPGNSSPVVAAGKVFVATALDEKGTQRSLMAFDRKDGKVLWTKTVAYQTPDVTHATNPYNAASPAADAERVVVWHASAGLYCYDHAGNELWKRDLGKFRHIWGWAGSPVIHGDTVFLNAGPGERQFVAAFDKKTGNELWRTDEPGGDEKKYAGSWSTPRVIDVNGKPQVLVFMSTKVNAYDPKTGKVIWTVEGAGPLAYSDVYVTPLMPDGSRIGMALAGYGGAAIGFRIDDKAAGDVTATHRLWQNKDKHPQRIGTGQILGDHVIVPNEPYISCHEVKTGKEVWRQNLGGERFWGGIVKVGDRLYVTSQKGTTFVFAADPTAYKQLAKNELGEASNSTPAVSDGQMFLRTAGHLWCVE
jgi:outer membrane protein assembly factor BamB